MNLFTQSEISVAQSRANPTAKKVNLSVESFELWRKYIYETTGIYFQDNKKYLLESRLQKRINFLGLATFEAYLDYVKFNYSGSAEIKYLYEAITINETYYFRNQPQLDALVTKILPEIIASKEKLETRIKLESGAQDVQAVKKHIRLQ